MRSDNLFPRYASIHRITVVGASSIIITLLGCGDNSDDPYHIIDPSCIPLMESARTLCVDNGDPRGARWDCPNITTDDFLSCKELCFDEVCKVGPENAQMVDHQMYFLSYQNEGTSDFSWIFQLKNLKGSSVDFHFGTWLSYPEPPEVASALMLGQDDENFIYLAWGANSIRGRDPELFCESHYLVLSTKGTNCSSLRGTARGLRVNRCIDESTDSNMSGIVYNYDVSCD